ncbi:hypothetical protein PAHAL_1G250000 [Panicum hallii]|uniref:Uncharacterized protein n=1 Tax=Panicum hallii TaxID=206008 RepID=A0A2T8KW87_9POAL|nr:hypothetical protein PAHAL_1G250000 [Panicum hallii]
MAGAWLHLHTTSSFRAANVVDLDPMARSPLHRPLPSSIPAFSSFLVALITGNGRNGEQWQRQDKVKRRHPVARTRPT